MYPEAVSSVQCMPEQTSYGCNLCGIGKGFPEIRRRIVKVVQLAAVERVERLERSRTIAHLLISISAHDYKDSHSPVRSLDE